MTDTTSAQHLLHTYRNQKITNRVDESSHIRGHKFDDTAAGFDFPCLHRLCQRLEPAQHIVLVSTLIRLGSTRVQRLKVALRSVSCDRLDWLAEQLTVAPVPWFQKYLEICSLSPINAHDVSGEQDDWACPSMQSTLAEEPRNTISVDCLAKRLQNLAPEISYKIGMSFLEIAFKPSHLFPDQIPNEKGQYIFQGRTYDKPHPMALLALDSGLLSTWEQKYWGENVWVIGKGYPHATLGCLNNMEDGWMRIRKAYLSLAIEDLPGAKDALDDAIMSAKEDGNLKYLDNFGILERFCTYRDTNSTELTQIWWAKLAAMIALPLNEFTLDLRDAYGPDGVLWAQPCWLRTLPWFRYGMPATFNILTREPELEEIVRGVFARINRRRHWMV